MRALFAKKRLEIIVEGALVERVLDVLEKRAPRATPSFPLRLVAVTLAGGAETTSRPRWAAPQSSWLRAMRWRGSWLKRFTTFSPTTPR